MKQFLFLISLLLWSWSSAASVIPGIIKIYDESEIDDLLEAGVSIERRRGDILLCYFPDSDDNEIVIPNGKYDREFFTRSRDPFPSKGKERHIKSWGKHDKGITTRPTLDEAITFFDAWKIPEGVGISSPLTGKGVVVGLCDIGLDPLHPTFLDDQGHSRIKQITQYREYEGMRLELRGDKAYAEWKTDSIDEFHATHVAGILAGNGARSPYRGIATDAEIVASLSCLTGFGLLMGVEDIIDYAKEVGKPAVINLSMGNYIGAHDGTSLFSQYLDLCADDAIIVLSAGNEGNATNTLSYRFEENKKKVEVRIGNRAWNQKDMYGITDIWNITDRPLKVTLCVFDDENHSVVYEYEPVILTGWDTVTYQWDPENPVTEGLSLDGYLTLCGGVDPENGRYEIYMMYDYVSTRLIGRGWAKDMVSIRIEGLPGDDIDVYADGTFTRLMAISGHPAPDSKFSISDLACGERVISVGMYGNRDSVPVSIFDESGNVTDTESMSLNTGPMQTVVYSSYGTLRDGRRMPLTVAPGYELMSSFSRPYAAHHEDARYYMAPDGSTWVSMGGTSMSSPFVAGFIATWLEALPDLKVEDVIDLLEETNSHQIPEPDNPRNINGYFNPYVALRKALDNNGVDQIKDPESILLPSDHIEIFDLTGLRIYAGRADGATHIKKGVYVVRTPFGVMKKFL